MRLSCVTLRCKQYYTQCVNKTFHWAEASFAEHLNQPKMNVLCAGFGEIACSNYIFWSLFSHMGQTKRKSMLSTSEWPGGGSGNFAMSSSNLTYKILCKDRFIRVSCLQSLAGLTILLVSCSEVVNKAESMEVWLASWCQAAVPHPAVGVHMLWRCNDLCDRKVDIMRVANTWCNATEPSKRSMDLNNIHTIFFCKDPTLALKWVLAHNEKKSTYSILPKYSAENSIRCICPAGPNHICWINVF